MINSWMKRVYLRIARNKHFWVKKTTVSPLFVFEIKVYCKVNIT